MKSNRSRILVAGRCFRKTMSFGANIPNGLIGNWITYDTGIKEIADFTEKVYLHRSQRFQR